jgi:hypothetical protein
MARSDFYLAAATLIRSGRVELLDHPKCLLQFACLECKTTPAGRDQVNDPVGGHDDACNAVAGALVTANTAPQAIRAVPPIVIERPRLSNSYGDASGGWAGGMASTPGLSVTMPGLANGPEYCVGDDAGWREMMGATARRLLKGT